MSSVCCYLGPCTNWVVVRSPANIDSTITLCCTAPVLVYIMRPLFKLSWTKRSLVNIQYNIFLELVSSFVILQPQTWRESHSRLQCCLCSFPESLRFRHFLFRCLVTGWWTSNMTFTRSCNLVLLNKCLLWQITNTTTSASLANCETRSGKIFEVTGQKCSIRLI